MLTAVFDIFTYCVCLFCSRIVVNVKEFDATVVQVRALVCYKAGSINRFPHKNMPVPIQLLSTHLMCLSFWF